MTRVLRIVSSSPSSPASRLACRTSPQQRALAPAGGRARNADAARRVHGFARPGAIAAEMPDPLDLRAHMADRWCSWIQRHFRRPEDAAVAFGVTFQCARNWFEGLHKPSGETVLMAAHIWGPEFTSHMRGER